MDGAPSFLDGFRVRTNLRVEGAAEKPGGGSWSTLSDRKLKKNIADLDGALDTLLNLRGVTYEYKDAEGINELPGTRTGFIAQDIEQIIPDWVSEDASGTKRVTIRGFEAMAVESFREQQEHIAALEARIESLESQRSVVGASMVWPVLLGGGVLGGLALARRRHASNATEA
ncbi:MAG: tail fiber domain-containing protein [Planctomycetota bacterium]